MDIPRALSFDDFRPVTLTSRLTLAEETHVDCPFQIVSFVFAFDDVRAISGLRDGQYCSLRIPESPEADPAVPSEGPSEPSKAPTYIVRYYSIVSPASQRGTLELLVKLNLTGDHGKMTSFLSSIQPGQKVEMKAERPAPVLDGKNRLLLISGGGGISACLQIIRATVPHHGITVDEFDSKKATGIKVDLIWAAGQELELWRPILYELARIQVDRPDVFSMTPILANPPKGWTGDIGYVDAEKLKRHGLTPEEGDKPLVIICGPPPMYKPVKASLMAVGFSESDIFTYS